MSPGRGAEDDVSFIYMSCFKKMLLCLSVSG